ncbi:uncharacterized protein BO96DRAFT_335207, partial [Aspergillus niger CBS 101883]
IAQVQPRDVFWIASCTKLITAICCMQLVERGHISLDDAEVVERLCPELKDVRVLRGGELLEKKRGITLRMLLTHTAQLASDTRFRITPYGTTVDQQVVALDASILLRTTLIIPCAACLPTYLACRQGSEEHEYAEAPVVCPLTEECGPYGSCSKSATGLSVPSTFQVGPGSPQFVRCGLVAGVQAIAESEKVQLQATQQRAENGVVRKAKVDVMTLDNIVPIAAITGALIEKCALESKKPILAIRLEGVKCSL